MVVKTVFARRFCFKCAENFIDRFEFGEFISTLPQLIKIFGCLFYVLTLGLIAFVVNALLFLLVGWLARLLHLPMHVEGFWSAFWGAIIVGVVSWVINLVLGDLGSRDA